MIRPLKYCLINTMRTANRKHQTRGSLVHMSLKSLSKFTRRVLLPRLIEQSHGPVRNDFVQPFLAGAVTRKDAKQPLAADNPFLVRICIRIFFDGSSISYVIRPSCLHC